MPSDPETPYKGVSSPYKRAAWTRPIPLDGVKAVGRATGTKVNDVLLAAATGALRRYMAARGEPTAGVEIRAAVPFNVRPLERAHELGNAFALVFLRLPVGVEDPAERLRLLKARMDKIKRSTEPGVVYGILQTIGLTPHFVHHLVVKLFATKATAVMTNVPGPQEQLHLLGVPLADVMFWVPQAGDLALGLSILSYDGRVLVGVASDATLADPVTLGHAFEEEFAALADRYAASVSTAP
jgi:WS/DGAT/MGAT family acyltransferase